MSKEKKITEYVEETSEPLENETPLSDIVENEEDKKILEVEKPPKKKNKFTFGYVIKPMAFLRKEDNEDSEIIMILKKNDAMLIDGESGDYYYGTANNKVGYILKEQIEIR